MVDSVAYTVRNAPNMATARRKKKRSPKIKGLCADARALGVRYDSLGKVLRGVRASATMLRRYMQLKAEQGKGAR
jgi:hypothetical protein